MNKIEKRDIERHVVETCYLEDDLQIDDNWSTDLLCDTLNRAIDSVSHLYAINVDGLMVWVDTENRILYRVRSEWVTSICHRW